jgi:hypothetical protein
MLRQYEDRYAERRTVVAMDDVALSEELRGFVERSGQFAARRPGEQQPSETNYFEPVREAENTLVTLIRDRYPMSGAVVAHAPREG